MSKILNIIIIIYNMKIEDSVAFQESYAYKNYFDITVVDNTTINDLRIENKNTAEKFEINYLTENANIGLSKAYNLAINYVKINHINIQWIITLDQDTILNKSYFDEALELISRPTDIFVYYPTVNSISEVISPVQMSKYLIKGEHKNVVCINSGLLINLKLFGDCSYDENLFLDMIDYDIFCQILMKGFKQKTKMMKSLIKQDFSGADFSSFEKDYERFKNYVSDFKTFTKKWKTPKIYTYFILFKRGLKLMLHFKSIKFVTGICKK